MAGTLNDDPLTGPGGIFEVVTEDVRGNPMTYLVDGEVRLSFAEHSASSS